MAKAKKTASEKPRANKYDEKLALKGNSTDVFKVVKKDKEDKKKSTSDDLEDYQELDERELGGEG